MQWVEFNSWKRRRHFDMFHEMDFPHFSLCVEVDVTESLAFCKAKDISSFVFIVWQVTRTANQIENFRYRIRDNRVCLHDKVDAAFTVLDDEDLYYHCTVEYSQDFNEFAPVANRKIDSSITNKTLMDSKGRDDLLYMSCLPWIKFTSSSHAMHLSPIDSIPRFYWGKYEQRGDRVYMPFSCQVHHGLVDGVHVGKLFSLFQDYLNCPAELFG